MSKKLTYNGKKPSRLMERDIRSSLSRTEINVYKLISDQNPDKIKALGRKLMRLTNTKLKTILLRSIHGDIYSGTRLKKFVFMGKNVWYLNGRPPTQSGCYRT